MKKRKYAHGFFTSVEIDDVEYAVEVHYDSSGPEPDVNWAGGVEIETVIHRTSDLDLTDRLSSAQLDAIAQEIVEHESDAIYAHADHLHDLRKEEGL